MKFIALFKKEFRICLPWLLLCIVAFTGFGYLFMKHNILFQPSRIEQGYQEKLGDYYFIMPTPIQEFGPLISITSLCLGVVLAVQQFLMPTIHRTWSFSLHRAIRPQMIMWAKFAAAGLTFIISPGLLWTLFYLYAAVPGRFYIPIFFKTFAEGWIYLLVGLIAYCGTALSILCEARFYADRLLGIAAAVTLICFIYMQSSLVGALVWLAVGTVLLTIQIFHVFLTKPY